MNSFLYFVYLGFFLSHIPITLLVDSQAGEGANAGRSSPPAAPALQMG